MTQVRAIRQCTFGKEVQDVFRHDKQTETCSKAQDEARRWMDQTSKIPCSSTKDKQESSQCKLNMYRHPFRC